MPIRKSIFHKSALLLTTAMITAGLATTAFAAEGSAAFSDVTQSSPYYEAVQYAYEQGITCGTGNGQFQPDAHITLPQFCAMYMRYAEMPEDSPALEADWAGYTMRQAVSNSLVSEAEAGNLSCDWVYVLEKLLEWENLPAYSQTLWGDKTEYLGLSVPDANTICSAKVYGLLDGIGVDDWDSTPSRGETVQLFYNLETSDSKDIVPDIVAFFPVDFDNVGIRNINDTYSTLMEVPSYYLEKFKDKGWTFHITTKRIHEIPGFEEYTTAVGITTYSEKKIYVYAPSTSTIRHEFGHFAEKVAVNESFPTEIYEAEKAGIIELAGEYSETSSSEAFACVFAYFCKYIDDDVKMAEFATKCPLTYDFLMCNYFTPEILSPTGEDFFVWT